MDTSISVLEVGLVVFIVLLATGVLYQAWCKKDNAVFSPSAFYSVLVLYYTVVGPIVTILAGDSYVFDVQVRPVLWKGWLAAAVAFVFFLAGYAIRLVGHNVIRRRTSDSDVFTASVVFLALSSVGMLFWLFRYGGGWSFLVPVVNEGGSGTSAANLESATAVYLAQLINLSFGGTSLLLLHALERRSKMTIFVFAVVIAFCLLFFLKTGFRYRIAWMAVSLAASYYLWEMKRPRAIVWIPLGVVFIGMMGLIGATRNYFSGLDMSRASGWTTTEILVNGFSESGTFFFLSQVVDVVPRELPHTSWDPFWVAITYPIPRSMWANKPESATLETMAASFGRRDAYSAGMAVPYFGEWYIAFGWTGVAVSSFLFGLLARAVWEWQKARVRDKMAMTIYSVGLGFVYVVFSRGLLAQAVLNFCFALLPFIIIYALLQKHTVRIVASNRAAEFLNTSDQARLGSRWRRL